MANPQADLDDHNRRTRSVRNDMQTRGVRIGWFVLVAAVAAGTLMLYSRVLPYVLAAALAAYLLNPVIYWLERRRLPRWLAICLVYVILLAVLGLATWLIVPPFLQQAWEVTETAERYILADSAPFDLSRFPQLERVDDFLRNAGARLGIDMESNRAALTTSLQEYLSGFLNGLTDTLLRLAALATYAVTVPIMAFFILLDHRKMKRWFLNCIPNRYYELTVLAIENIDRTIGTYLKAVLVEIAAVAVLSAIALQIVGVRYALVIGLLAGLANAIPWFGPVLGMALAAISALLGGGGVSMAAWSIVSMMLVQVVDNNLIYPIVIGKNTELHPLLIMLTVIAGGYLFGLMGMFLSVPVVFLVRGTLQVLYHNLKAFNIL
ncbi:MAG: AI-2E family transporter [Candidatus Cloacimonetes bacterium]|nr:AI-2E family transporter [Candidatus Cloacimonadota bacterium]